MAIVVKVKLVDHPGGPILTMTSVEYGEYYVVQLKNNGTLLRYDGLPPALCKVNPTGEMLFTTEVNEE